MQKEDNPNDVDAKKNHELTHAPDALRGFCVMRHYPSETPGFRLPDDLPEDVKEDLKNDPEALRHWMQEHNRL
jgi:hypothetical protein